MFDFAGDYRLVTSLLFLLVTEVIAVKGIQHRDEDGNIDFVRLVFGCVSAVFFLMVLMDDILGLKEL